jgi:hypothetical protein
MSSLPLDNEIDFLSALGDSEPLHLDAEDVIDLMSDCDETILGISQEKPNQSHRPIALGANPSLGECREYVRKIFARAELEELLKQ